MLEASASYGFRNSISLVFFATQVQRKRLRCTVIETTSFFKSYFCLQIHQKTTIGLQRGRLYQALLMKLPYKNPLRSTVTAGF